METEDPHLEEGESLDYPCMGRYGNEKTVPYILRTKVGAEVCILCTMHTFKPREGCGWESAVKVDGDKSLLRCGHWGIKEHPEKSYRDVPPDEIPNKFFATETQEQESATES